MARQYVFALVSDWVQVTFPSGVMLQRIARGHRYLADAAVVSQHPTLFTKPKETS
jgi:hypothetical protein